jgi:hypothetical protein
MNFSEMKVPRRPPWDETTTAAELNLRERESFLAWRRDIAMYDDFVSYIHNDVKILMYISTEGKY